MSASGEVRVDLSVGNLARLVLRDEGTPLEPLHRAPWVDDPQAIVDHLPPVEQRLSGDFFCAPFGDPVSGNGPRHGPPANTRWRHVTQTYSDWASHQVMVMELLAPVQGAALVKEIALGVDAPILYQTHRLSGGEGLLPVATHPMVRLAPGDRITVSPKMHAVTGEVPIVAGRHLLTYPATATDLTAFPGVAGPVDLTRYPEGTGTEDLVQLVEAPGHGLGWTAVTRAEDVVFVVKDPASLPVTQLWFSNGGKREAPWNGRHTGVLGIEDARIPTGSPAVPAGLELAPDTTHVISHAIGAIRRPPGWTFVASVDIRGDGLVLTGDDASQVTMPFARGFF
jgi:hypothetical protein